MEKILLAAPIKNKITEEMRLECRKLKESNITPFLKMVLVGKNPASLVYTGHKKKYCESIGAQCEIVELPNNISIDNFLHVIRDINQDPLVHGCIVQLPLPSHLAHIDVGRLILKHKDVDGFHPENLYGVLTNSPNRDEYFTSCTPKGILTLLDWYKIPLKGTRVVIIGRSMIVGKPLGMLLTNRDATVTICHSRTQNIRKYTQNSDLIITAIGKPNLIDETYLSPLKNQIIVDVGINRNENGDLCGDVNYQTVFDHVKAITPVPGGVGPMTIVSLMQNLLQSARKAVIKS